ncbi:PAS domain S-box protein [bacterium]|nr:PAS domain S-box protein [bacterium]
MRWIDDIVARSGRVWANQPLAVKGVVVVALPLTILLIALLSLYVASRAEARAEADVRAAFAIQRDIHEVHALLAEAASGVRGYLLTGQERFLAPYIKAEAEIPAAFARLDAEIRDSEVRRRFDVVTQLAARKREGLAALRNIQGAGTREALARPDVLAALVANKAVLDGLRDEIEAMQAHESDLLAARQQRADEARARNLVLTAISGAVGLLGSFAAVYLFSTGIVRRVQALEANARRLERGEPLPPLPVEADEIGRLGAKLEEASLLLRRREQALREGEERFRLVIEGVKDYGIFVLDPEGRVVSWNEGAERIKGWRAEEILGQSFATFYPDETRAIVPPRMLATALRDGRAEDEGWRLRKDGSRFWANVVVTALHDEVGRLRGYSKVTRDMTERKRAEEALSEAREAAVAANLAKSEFLSRTSHELRTPLSAILGFAQLLELDKSQMSARQTAAVEQILKAGRHLLALINEVLDISSIEAGRMEFWPETFDLRDALTEALELTSPIAEAAGVSLASELPATPIIVRADRRRVVQVALNLLSNAVKYNRVDGETRLRVVQDDGWTRVAVMDEGPGVAEAAAARLFTPFDRLGRERTAGVEGTGLGLALSKRLVEAMDGAIGFENRTLPDRGAVFWFELPTHVSPAPSLARQDI